MTSKGLGEMFEGNSADMCAGKFPLVLMGDRAEGLACVVPGVEIVLDSLLQERIRESVKKRGQTWDIVPSSPPRTPL